MSLSAIVPLAFLLFGGGGYYGYRYSHDGGRSVSGGLGLVLLVLPALLVFAGFGEYAHGYC